MPREGEAPAEPQTMENVTFHAAQQELRPPKEITHLETSKSLGKTNLTASSL